MNIEPQSLQSFRYSRGSKAHYLGGKRFGRLIALRSLVIKKKKSILHWECICDCGGSAIVSTDNLRRGNTTSCGCYKKEKTSERLLKHGDNRSNNKKTPEYRAWYSMKTRCYNSNIKRYADYGGRGIRVCERWLSSYENFLEDMGRKPSSQHSLDRIDNNLNYEPSNCRWATHSEQNNNKRQYKKRNKFNP